jgi:hypothetical protein
MCSKPDNNPSLPNALFGCTATEKFEPWVSIYGDVSRPGML